MAQLIPAGYHTALTPREPKSYGPVIVFPTARAAKRALRTSFSSDHFTLVDVYVTTIGDVWWAECWDDSEHCACDPKLPLTAYTPMGEHIGRF